MRVIRKELTVTTQNEYETTIAEREEHKRQYEEAIIAAQREIEIGGNDVAVIEVKRKILITEKTTGWNLFVVFLTTQNRENIIRALVAAERYYGENAKGLDQYPWPLCMGGEPNIIAGIIEEI